MSLNRSRIPAVLSFMSLVLLGCEAREEPEVLEQPAPAVESAPAESADTSAQTVELEPAGNSQTMGVATLTPHGRQTTVHVQLEGAPEGAHMGHVHEGTCDDPGAVVAPLEEIDVASGAVPAEMSTEIPLPADSLMNGGHLIAYHAHGAPEHGPTIACGEIPEMEVNR